MRPLLNTIGVIAGLEGHKMKLRILAALVLIPVLLLVVFVAPIVFAVVIIGLLCALSVYELLWSTGILRQPRLVIYAAIVAFFVPIWCYYGTNALWAKLGILGFFCILFGEVLLSRGKLKLEKISACIFAGIVLPYLLSSLTRILEGPQGRLFLFIPFVAAFLSDTGAYFVGSAWGKHKLAPTISPNKSVEGMLGGLVVAVLGMLLYTWILSLVTGLQANYFFAVIYGLLGALAGVFGDLCFSAIKRQTGIKDFGSIIPGHGGILDRFDSVMTVAPLMELMLQLLPILE